MHKNKLIIQASPQRTGSTLLVNALHGLIPHLCNTRIKLDWTREPLFYSNDRPFVIKSHEVDLDKLTQKYNNFELIFVCSERKTMGIEFEDKYKYYKNAVIFDFDELNERADYTLPDIVQCIYDKMIPMLPDIVLNKETCLNRLQRMNQRYGEICDMPFSYVDRFYHLHGSHRKRDGLLLGSSCSTSASPLPPSGSISSG
jgi:hypothetical protein